MAHPSAHNEPHVASVGTYVAVFLALMVLTAVTVAAAFVDLGALNNVVMLAIAISKATMVVLIFMHVKHSTRLIKLTVAAGFGWLLILFAYTLQDYLTRHWDYVAKPWS
jgi:cytochrome c oxidase subunit 4